MEIMIYKFAEWLDDAARLFYGKVQDFMENAICIFIEFLLLIVALILSPVWIGPFLYWYFAVWNKREGEEEHE